MLVRVEVLLAKSNTLTAYFAACEPLKAPSKLSTLLFSTLIPFHVEKKVFMSTVDI